MLIRDVSSSLKPDLLFRASILFFYQKADLCEGPLPSPPSSGPESPCAPIFLVLHWNYMEQRMSDNSGRKLVRRGDGTFDAHLWVDKGAEWSQCYGEGREGLRDAVC